MGSGRGRGRGGAAGPGLRRSPPVLTWSPAPRCCVQVLPAPGVGAVPEGGEQGAAGPGGAGWAAGTSADPAVPRCPT